MLQRKAQNIIKDTSHPAHVLSPGFFLPLDIPSAPGRVVPTRNTDTSIVVSWVASKDAKELVGYYIEASIAGTNVWEPCNNKPVKGTRYIHHNLLKQLKAQGTSTIFF